MARFNLEDVHTRNGTKTSPALAMEFLRHTALLFLLRLELRSPAQGTGTVGGFVDGKSFGSSRLSILTTRYFASVVPMFVKLCHLLEARKITSPE